MGAFQGDCANALSEALSATLVLCRGDRAPRSRAGWPREREVPVSRGFIRFRDVLTQVKMRRGRCIYLFPVTWNPVRRGGFIKRCPGKDAAAARSSA